MYDAYRFRLLAASFIGGMAVVTAASADNLIIDNQGSKWRFNGASSNLIVVPAKPGDTIQIQITGGSHGFVTLDKPGNSANPQPQLDLVKSCPAPSGTPSPSPSPTNTNAVAMLEEDCSAGEQFNIPLQAGTPLRLKATDAAKGDVNFWCIVHQRMMSGVIRFPS